MPTLPDKSALGGLGSQVSGRGVPKIGDLTTGEQAVTAALGKVGGALMGIAEEEAKQADALGLAKAQAHLSEGLHQTELAFDSDPDHKTFSQRYDVSAKRIVGEAADFIPNEYTREKWLASHAAERTANSKHRVLRHGLGLARQEKLGEVEDALRRHQNRALDPNLSDDDRFRVLGDIDSTVELGLRSGLLSPREGYSFRDTYLGGTIRDDAERRLMPGTPAYDPDGLIKDLQGGRSFDQWLVKRESSGRPDLVNKQGYVGLYQFGAPRLAHLGLYKPGTGERLEGKWSGDKWSGEFAIPGFEEVKTLEDFKANPEAQQAAFGRHLEMVDAEIDKAGLDKYIGQKVGGVTITHDGLRAMLHLGGLGSAKRALESNGADNPADANGTSVLDYARQAGASSRYGLLTPQQRHALLTNAKIAQRSDVTQALQDDVESIRRTGSPAPRPGGDTATALQRAAQVMTPNQYRKAEIAVREAQLEHQATAPLSEMSEREAVDHIVKFAPEGKESGDSYKTAARVQAKAERTWRRIAEERTKDPARAVSGMRMAGTTGSTLRMGPDGELQVQEGEPELAMGPAREVRSAIDQIKKRTPTVELVEEDGGISLKEKPGEGPPPQAAWRLLIEGRLAAQARLGVPAHSQKVLTRSEAARLLDMPAEGQLSDEEFSRRLRIAADRADQTFGPYGPQALKSALSFYIRNKEHQEEMVGVITRLARGQRRESIRPSEIESMRRLDELNRIEEMFKGEGVRKAAEKFYPKPEDHHLDWAMAKPGRETSFDERYGPGAYARESAKRAGSP